MEVDQDDFKSLLSSAVDVSTGECHSNFSCGICMELVVTPEECSECNQMFCGVCIEKWQLRNDTCPSCREECTIQEMNKTLKKILEGTLLKGCPASDCVRS